ncbi:MAG: fluoride efflux transporter CrcB, partial [Phycisphaerae bacterium]
MPSKILFLCLAGAAGTLSRYALSGLVQRSINSEFPIGTAAVNIIGCLLFGLLWALTENRINISGQFRIIIFVGFFGAFTTFSTFIYETARLADDSQYLWAAANFFIQNFVGFVCLVTGLA